MPLLPSDHPIPPGFENPRFKARPITIHDAVKDYDAVMTSADRLRERFPLWGWPPEEGLTLEQDLIDLAWHQKEAELKRSFSYVVLSPDESCVLGCVHVDPPERTGADAETPPRRPAAPSRPPSSPQRRDRRTRSRWRSH